MSLKKIRGVRAPRRAHSHWVGADRPTCCAVRRLEILVEVSALAMRFSWSSLDLEQMVLIYIGGKRGVGGSVRGSPWIKGAKGVSVDQGD